MIHRVGPHSARSEQDILYVTFAGVLQLEEIQQILFMMEDLIKNHGRYGAIVDARAMTTITPAARRHLAQWQGAKHCFGSVIIGAGLAARTVLMLVTRAIQIFNATRLQTAFFPTEAEGLAWLDSRRAQALAEALPKGT